MNNPNNPNNPDKYAVVCVDLQAKVASQLFTYKIPPDMPVVPGMKLEVPFGNKYVNGFVLETTNETTVEPAKLKFIFNAYQDYIIPADLLDLAQWLSQKYYTLLIHCLVCVSPNVPKNLRLKNAAACESSEKMGEKTGKNFGFLDTTAQFDLNFELNFELNGEQKAAIKQIFSDSQKGNRPTVLHGVTGSGKTEVYMHIIAEVLRQGKQAIMLVPEIALTYQVVQVFKARFGEAALFTHSGLTAKERFENWQKALNGEVAVMIGPRSAVFAPFDNLGAIIIDEEHEHSYRQSDLPPKFDTKEVALKRQEYAKNSGGECIVVFGSATPSLESYYRAAATNEFALVTMPSRINEMFPLVNIVDMRRELAAGNTSMFGAELQKTMLQELNAGRQAILFLNRRGHSSFVSCRKCGYVMGCTNCNVNLTYHTNFNQPNFSQFSQFSRFSQEKEKLLCHYCGISVPVPNICPACSSKFIKYFGLGTQKIEEEVAKIFTGFSALRMDMDTTRGKQGHAKILAAFRKNEAQILIGTQMVAKGLDFPNVTIVGIMAADLSLYSGSFRAAENTFQLITQVSGRAGRAAQLGKVFIQTYNPEHYSIKLAQTADYTEFYRQEITLRRAMNYPPFCHIFVVLFSAADEPKIIAALQKLLAVMQYCNRKGNFELFGPMPAIISKIKKQFRWKLLIKSVNEELLKQFVLYCLGKLKDNDPLAGITINLTLDPMAME
ncbi:MAG: primosomal protein N' [Defluviitaleaceae bacterium]|nr:primosomal protein N' [Defluviitaleaceae bacterium]